MNIILFCICLWVLISWVDNVQAEEIDKLYDETDKTLKSIEERLEKLQQSLNKR